VPFGAGTACRQLVQRKRNESHRIGNAAILLDSTEVADLTTPGYLIRTAQAEHIPALSAIELAAAQLLRGHAPESVLAEAHEERTFANAARDGRLWVASTGNMPVGFALVKMLAEDLPISKRLTSTRLTGAAAWAGLWYQRCASGRRSLGTSC
jgi:hypothetical protein